ncbi:hypothetical protein CLOM_g12360, partial [Closterium sp. NIES-68]
MMTTRRLCMVAAAVLAVVLSSQFHAVASVAIKPDQVQALMAMKSAMSLPFASWDSAAPECTSWQTLTCNSAGDVVYMFWNEIGIVRKSFPADISKLTGLTKLWMIRLIDGDIGKFVKPFSTLISLDTLSLQYNWFHGTFPSVLLTLPKLTDLNLGSNLLYGPLPAAASKFVWLTIYDNWFTGPAPTGPLTCATCRPTAWGTRSRAAASSVAQECHRLCHLRQHQWHWPSVRHWEACVGDTDTAISTRRPRGYSPALFKCVVSFPTMDAGT